MMTVISAIRYTIRAMAAGVLLVAIGTMTSAPVVAGQAGCVPSYPPFGCFEFPANFSEEAACLENGQVVPQGSECVTCVEHDDEECKFGYAYHFDYVNWDGGEN